MDVVTAFLHGDLDENIYMEVPQGLQSSTTEGKVCKLLKSLYGLKQAPRQWYDKIHKYLVTQLRFVVSMNDPCLYIRKSLSATTLIALYVDDLLIISNSKPDISKLKEDFKTRFEMKDLGPAQKMLGIEINRNRSDRKLWISQQVYTDNVLKRFCMDGARSVDTPMEKSLPSTRCDEACTPSEDIPFREVIGSLIYLVSCTRPDIAFAVHRLSQQLESPTIHHWTAVKRILRYLSGTKYYGIQYGGANSGTEITGYSDSD